MSDDGAVLLSAEALLAHLRAERAQWMTRARSCYGPLAWETSDERLRLAGYDQAIIDAEKWIWGSRKEETT